MEFVGRQVFSAVVRASEVEVLALPSSPLPTFDYYYDEDGNGYSHYDPQTKKNAFTNPPGTVVSWKKGKVSKVLLHKQLHMIHDALV